MKKVVYNKDDFDDTFSMFEKIIILVTICIISFMIGFISFYVIKLHQLKNSYNEYSITTAQYFEPIPDTVLSQYYEDGGHVQFVSRQNWQGYNWSVGYYTKHTNNIYVCWDIGSLDSYEQILAHEMSHYLYFTDKEFNIEKWESIAASEYENSQYYVVLDENGNHYYADPAELFAQQASLYMRATNNNSYEADRDAQIMWIFEKVRCPECTEFIENYFSVYYN